MILCVTERGRNNPLIPAAQRGLVRGDGWRERIPPAVQRGGNNPSKPVAGKRAVREGENPVCRRERNKEPFQAGGREKCGVERGGLCLLARGRKNA